MSDGEQTNRCCENGFFGQTHDCRKGQPPPNTPKETDCEAREPLIGWMILEDHCEDMSDWSGVISFPDPTGANLAWENPTKMIEHRAFEKLRKENERLRADNAIHIETIAGTFARNCKFADENEALRAALKFYSGEDYVVTVTKAAEEGGTLVIDDGDLARKALTKGPSNGK